MAILLVALGTAVVYAFGSLRIIKQYERGVTFLLGKSWATKGPGLVCCTGTEPWGIELSFTEMAQKIAESTCRQLPESTGTPMPSTQKERATQPS